MWIGIEIELNLLCPIWEKGSTHSFAFTCLAPGSYSSGFDQVDSPVSLEFWGLHRDEHPREATAGGIFSLQLMRRELHPVGGSEPRTLQQAHWKGFLRPFFKLQIGLTWASNNQQLNWCYISLIYCNTNTGLRWTLHKGGAFQGLEWILYSCLRCMSNRDWVFESNMS